MDQPFDLVLSGGTVVNQDGAHRAGLHPGDVLHHEVPRAEGVDEPPEVKNQLVAGVRHLPLPDGAEAAGRDGRQGDVPRR